MSSMSPSRLVQLEIAVQDVAGALAAVRNGADRIELCVALGAGGLTPSIGLVREVCSTVAGEPGGERVGVCVLVRPCEGGFVYDESALGVMTADVAALAEISGVAAVVIGALTPTRRVDRNAMERIIAATQGLPVVFHRAIDVAPSPEKLLPDIIALGCVRVLTSGGAPRCGQGIAELRRMVTAASGRVQIMAGGGVTVGDIPAILDAGVDAVHLSAKATRPSEPAGPGGGMSEVLHTDGVIVAQARKAIDRFADAPAD